MFGTQPIGRWSPEQSPAAWQASEIAAVCLRCREQFFLVRDANGRIGVGVGGQFSAAGQGGSGLDVLSILPPLYPEWLGSREFTELHGLRFAYVSGAMANGIASVELVEAIAATGQAGDLIAQQHLAKIGLHRQPTRHLHRVALFTSSPRLRLKCLHLARPGALSCL